jgi:hypothetical protein
MRYMPGLLTINQLKASRNFERHEGGCIVDAFSSLLCGIVFLRDVDFFTRLQNFTTDCLISISERGGEEVEFHNHGL